MTKPPTMQQGHSNDFQTPAWALLPLYKYLFGKKVWECACGKGNLVKAMEDYGIDVLGTDINYGRMDFLNMNNWCDTNCIVTNPPYTIKDKFLEHCYEIGKPFALLMPLTALEGIKRQALYRKHGLELILLPKRVNFETPTGEGAGAWFASAWFTNGFNVGKDMTFWQNNET